MQQQQENPGDDQGEADGPQVQEQEKPEQTLGKAIDMAVFPGQQGGPLVHIIAAKAVAFATNLLIESADGVLSGTHSPEQLIVASNEVAAATAQLVAASRVKASLMSKTQDRLELAAKAVTEACKALVKQVKAIAAKEIGQEDVDYKNMANLEFKRREMEQQVEILKLEKDLGAARRRLGAMRRAGYHTDETD